MDTAGTNTAGLREHERENQRYWDGKAEAYARHGERQWARDPVWGIWSIPNAELPLLPDDLDGQRCIELGCGTAFASGWMARRGGDVVGVDIAAGQLATARRLADEHDVDLALHHASAEDVPEPDASFDVAISEYGASIWCEPRAWLGEAARLLRPGGRLSFLAMHPLVIACSPLDGSLPATRRLERPWFGDQRHDWRDAADDPGGIEWCPTVGAWFRALHDAGFEVTDYREVRAPASAVGEEAFGDQPFTGAWARDFPSEHVFWARRR